MNKLIILVTGSRSLELMEWMAACNTATLMLKQETALRGPENVLVVHGAAKGWDNAFESAARLLGVRTLPHPADGFISPLARNRYMVSEVSYWHQQWGYDVVCWTFAKKWASGTGHCAREARRANITVIDYGEETE